MVVVMKAHATEQEVNHVVELVREMGLKDNVIAGTERTVVAVVGDDRAKDRGRFESVPGVERVVKILAPYKMASRESRPEQTVVEVGPAGVSFGGTSVPVVAGPCSVEDRGGFLEVAHALKDAGATGLRGGAFKPRTSPYAFQGLGEEGLKIMAEAREQTGLFVCTEVMSIDQVAMVDEHADMLQIGARNMQNYNLLAAVGKGSDKPVLLKRGLSATLDEFLLAAEYVIDAGNPNVILCERGVRTFEDYVRNTLPLAIVPELHRVSHLPVVVDPSHGTGKSHLVESMCKASVAAGADGLIVEVHPDPSHAKTDGAQSLTVEQFREMVEKTRRVAAAVDREM